MNDMTNQSSSNDEQKQHLISDVNYQRLQQLQQEIYTVIEMSPSVRKLVNLLITEENLMQLKQQLLARYR